MTTNLYEILNSIDCNAENVSNVCFNKLDGYNYSYGASKIVVYSGDWVIKKVFGKTYLNECEIYQKAIKDGVADFFAASLKKTDNIYKQERVDVPLNHYVHEMGLIGEKIPYGILREDYRKIGLGEMLNRSDCTVLYYLFQQNSLEDILKLQKFIVENDLTDLNFYNAGFRKGRLVFFDYSGIDMELME